MNEITSTTVTWGDRYLFPLETQARTDEEFWQILRRQRGQSRLDEAERLNTNTSMKTDEWRKQLYVNYRDNSGRHRIISFLSLANSEEKDTVIKEFSRRFSSSIWTPQSSEIDWSDLIVGSTALIITQEERIREELEVLFLSYDNEDFEDGMGNDFVKELKFFILRYGNKAVHAIANIIARRHTNPQVIFEALRWLGCISHPESYQLRLFLLEKSLYNPSRWIRDGAALGLASMNDVHAIPYLHEAIKREKIKDLQEDLQTILIRLEHLL